MPFPKTDEERLKAGYLYLNTSICRGCKRNIEWWETPNGKRIPLNADGEAHFSTCSHAADFRKKAG